MILAIRSDSQDVTIGIYQASDELAVENWQAGRELSAQILTVIENLCKKVNITQEDFTGIIVYEGPGSYTGLRISISVVNAIGYTYNLPVAGSTGDNWLAEGMKKLEQSRGFSTISPIYGGEVYTTKPKK